VNKEQKREKRIRKRKEKRRVETQEGVNTSQSAKRLGNWTAEGLGFNFRQRQEIFLFSVTSRPALGLHPASYPMGTGGHFAEDKATGSRRWPLTSILCRS
jgi:hypothetical protein